MANNDFAFDAETANTYSGALAFELPPNQQRLGPESPNPSLLVSDHSAEGAPWVPTADNFERQPGWAWLATDSRLSDTEYFGVHDEPTPPFDAASRDSYYGQTYGPAPGWNHDGDDASQWDPAYWGHGDDTQPSAWGLIDIGRPFTIQQGSARHRTLVTDTFDSTGKRITPADAPSAPHEIYGSEVYTRPRLTEHEHGPLFTWAWAEGQQFPSSNPGYWGVSANEPNMSPRPQGAVVAQMPGDPYVSSSVPGPPSGGAPDPYDFGF